MTGEITLRGRVLPIGGLKEKTLAAYRAGIRTLVIPKENDKDLEEIPPHVIKLFKVVKVTSLEEVLAVALTQKPVPYKPTAEPQKTEIPAELSMSSTKSSAIRPEVRAGSGDGN